jgi:hypothetical protein
MYRFNLDTCHFLYHVYGVQCDANGNVMNRLYSEMKDILRQAIVRAETKPVDGLNMRVILVDLREAFTTFNQL